MNFSHKEQKGADKNNYSLSASMFAILSVKEEGTGQRLRSSERSELQQ